ncbi:alpha-ketoglutarate-dependent dioxygenase AlkB family protein [Salinicola peritrichatus]|uniref:alpha-ketoglutarate-dependent dioxygenase AlkB family protein n=1 Tax=Salinicola peritrichatus TaxID=1267424 RepID=UPI000DA20C6B|nr:alpha-ketoglutarate-dependent dioxygenase AlkB [Salinicola peritrichatus]
MVEDGDTLWQILHTAPLLALHPAFLGADEASRLLATLERDIAWASPSIQLYGRHHPIPRSQCWMGDEDARYRYSGRSLEPHPWHAAVEALRDRVVNALHIAELPAAQFNSVLLNRYASGDQRMGWHSDDEPELGVRPIVASISLGSERPLRFREKRPQRFRENRGQYRRAFNVWLPHGSLLLMGPGVQESWQHALAPRAIPGVRINLTFRSVRSSIPI